MAGEQLPLMVTEIRHRRSAECHPAREYFADGKCKKCYSRDKSRADRVRWRDAGLCMICGHERGATPRLRCRQCLDKVKARQALRLARKPALCGEISRRGSKNWHHRNPLRAMIVHARHRAKQRGFEFSITEADISIPAVCPILGIPLAKAIGWKAAPGSPSLDRIDNTKGYIPGNVWVISMRANRIKGDASLAELKAVVAAMEGIGRCRAA